MSVFYDSYGKTKAYRTPDLNTKLIKRFDEEVWTPAGMQADMRCLEIGCGTGLFLSYLAHKGVSDFVGMDHDPALKDIMPENIRGHFQVADALEFLRENADGAAFDRVLMFDVFEHFAPEDGRVLLLAIAAILEDDGLIVLKMPNASSPWGLQFQYGDLTHRAAYTPESIRQMSVAANLKLVSCHPHLLGSPSRRFYDRCLQWTMGKMVATPPQIWEGNFYAILAKS